VTHNLKDFPGEKLPRGLEAIPPAVFAANTVELNPVAARAAVHAIASRTGRYGPTLTVADVLELLVSRYGMSQAVELVRDIGST